MMKKITLSILLLFIFEKSNSQIGISATPGLVPDPKAMLDISSTTKGLLIPRMTTAQRNLILPTATQIGLTVYDITTKSQWSFDGAIWKEMAGGAGANVPSPLYLNSSSTTITGETNQEDESGILGINTTGNVGSGVIGRATNTNPVETTVGVKGENMSANSLGYGVHGIHNGTGVAGYFVGTNALETVGAAKFGGNVAIQGTNSLELGAGIAGKEASAGKMGYAIFTPNTVDIVGGGEDFNLRKIKMWAEGGVDFTGGVNVSGPSTITGNTNILGNLMAIANPGSPAIPSETSSAIFRIGLSDIEGIDFGKIDFSPFSAWMQTGSNGANAHPLSLQPVGGNVGIGILNPIAPLSFASSTGNKISLWGNATGEHFGLGIQGGLLQMYTNISGSDIAFGHGSSLSFIENMRIKGNGNVGINSPNPSEKLVVGGNVNITGEIKPAGVSGTAGQVLQNNGNGTMQWASTSSAPTYAIGDFVQGGIVFWVNQTGEHGKVVCMADLGFGYPWSNISTENNAIDEINGAGNTVVIVNQGGHLGSAAKLCADFSYSGYDDWYLPAISELIQIFAKKIEINASVISNGGNEIENSWYWSSTESNTNPTLAKVVAFGIGNIDEFGKTLTHSLRAIRAF